MLLEGLYSRIFKKKNKLFSDIYQYEEIPEKLKITLYKIFQRALIEICNSQYHRITIGDICREIHDIICEEHSFHYLYKQSYAHNHYEDNLIKFFLDNKELLIGLDIIQLFLIRINEEINTSSQKNVFREFINEINKRMLEHSFGYQFENNLMIRIDTKHTHKEIVKPSFILLQDSRFKNADIEYRNAYEALKRNDYENVMVECNKAFESTMKIICSLNKFSYNQTDASNKLIKVLIENKFIYSYSEEFLISLSKILSTPSILRNKEGGHGSGVKEKEIEISYVNFVLHSTATNILFLMERQKEFKK